MEQRIYADTHKEGGHSRLQRADGPASDYTVPSVSGLRAVSSPDTEVPVRASSGYLFLKRAFDIAASALLLLVCFVPLLVISLRIRRESPGPAIYRRQVLARQEWELESGEGALETFPAFKLRTMIPDAEEYLKRHPHLHEAFMKDWKLQDDPRITRMGAFLRSTSIDEIPQLLNVLKGEMSLIGPRMITVPELARYGAHGPRLLRVKPGLTGLWQVSGRQELSYEERVCLDMKYIETRSVWLDAKILMLTVKSVLMRRGAY